MPVPQDATFGTFADGGDLIHGDIVVGLRGGVNTRFNFQGDPGLYLPLAGGTMQGAINMDSNGITGVPTPTLPSDAVNKSYADGLVAGEALTRTDDANVTLTLGGTPATALLHAVSLTLGWTGQLSVPRGGTGAASFTAYGVICGGTTSTDALQTVSGLGSANQVLVSNGAGALPSWQSVPGLVPAAMTKVDDSNVTLTLGGTPATSLLQAVSLTLGWTGQLSLARGGTNANLTASNGGIVYSDASALAILAGTATANLPLLSGSSTAPSWGAFALNLGGALTTAAAFTTSGAFAVTQTYTGITNVTFPTSGTLATTSQIPTGAALTKTDDTNVTLTLGGSPSTALVNAASLTLGWTGQLAVSRGGTGAGTLTGLLTGNGTSAITGTAITQYNVLTGGASNVPNSVAPSATSGVPLISQGASSQPVFGTAVVAGGGTGNTTFTAYSVICAGTTATGAFQNVSGVGTAGQALVSNGAGALPSWQSVTVTSAINQVVVQTFTSSGTYTPTTGMKYCTIECIGAGGGGGGAALSTNIGAGGGGGAGGYSRKTVAAATIGASQTVTIGTGGSGGSAGNNNGSAGSSATSVGTICVANAGSGGGGAAANTWGAAAAGGAAGTGDVTAYGNAGSDGCQSSSSNAFQLPQGRGGAGWMGGQPKGQTAGISTGGQAAVAGQSYGAGGNGGGSSNSSAAAAGAAGANGFVIITEYLSV